MGVFNFTGRVEAIEADVALQKATGGSELLGSLTGRQYAALVRTVLSGEINVNDPYFSIVLSSEGVVLRARLMLAIDLARRGGNEE